MRYLLTLAFLLVAVPAFAQAPSPECDLPAPGAGNVTNPTGVCFIASFDHMDIDHYELDLVSSSGAIMQTINMGKPVPQNTPNGEQWVVWQNLNVMPVQFGTYTSVARSVGDGVTGPASDPSNFWDREPGRPGGPRVVWHFDDDRDHWMGRAVLTD